MDGVTDYACRYIVKKYGRPDLLFTEFVNVEGLCKGAAGNLMPHFVYDPSQKPIIAQIFGKTPEYFYLASLVVAELGFAGVDLNMGCPARTVAQSGSGAALIAKPQLAQKIIAAAQQAMQDFAHGKKLADCDDVNPKLTRALAAQKEFWQLSEVKPRLLPVSVKTRIGLASNELKTWLPYLIEMQPATISLHGRSLKQGYSGQADWEAIAQAQQMIKQANPAIKIFGNGDVTDYEMAEQRVKTTGVDGVLFGRSSFGNPFVFLPKNEREKIATPEKFFQLAIDHAQVFEEYNLSRGRDKFFSMRKHLAWYIKGIPGAAKLRAQLVQSNSASEVKKVLANWSGDEV